MKHYRISHTKTFSKKDGEKEAKTIISPLAYYDDIAKFLNDEIDSRGLIITYATIHKYVYYGTQMLEIFAFDISNHKLNAIDNFKVRVVEGDNELHSHPATFSDSEADIYKMLLPSNSFNRYVRKITKMNKHPIKVRLHG